MRTWCVEGTVFVTKDKEDKAVAVSFSVTATDFASAVILAEELASALGIYDIWSITETEEIQ